MTNIETIRKAFDKWIKGSLKTEDFIFLKTIPNEVKNQALGFYHGYKIALSTIDRDAKSQEPSEDAEELVGQVRERAMGNVMLLSTKEAADLITAHDDAIRREERAKCAKAVVDFYTDQDLVFQNDIDFFNKRIRSRLVSAILGTEPAREDTILNGQWNELRKVLNYEPARDES